MDMTVNLFIGAKKEEDSCTEEADAVQAGYCSYYYAASFSAP
jgi:hypothetical protein